MVARCAVFLLKNVCRAVAQLVSAAVQDMHMAEYFKQQDQHQDQPQEVSVCWPGHCCFLCLDGCSSQPCTCSAAQWLLVSRATRTCSPATSSMSGHSKALATPSSCMLYVFCRYHHLHQFCLHHAQETAEERGRRIASQWTNDPEAAATAATAATAAGAAAGVGVLHSMAVHWAAWAAVMSLFVGMGYVRRLCKLVGGKIHGILNAFVACCNLMFVCFQSACHG